MTILLRLVLVLLMISFCPEYLGDPGDLSAKIQRSRELLSAGKFEEAIPVCKDVVQALPNNPGPLLNLGIALHMAGHDKEALSQFQAILKLEPNHLPARLFLGAAISRSGPRKKPSLLSAQSSVANQTIETHVCFSARHIYLSNSSKPRWISLTSSPPWIHKTRKSGMAWGSAMRVWQDRHSNLWKR